jgi:hypothetical protein
MVTDGQIIIALNNEECYNTIYFKNKRKNKIDHRTPGLHFAACYIMEIQMVFYQSSVINSDITNYLILIYQEKMSDRDM